MRFVPGSFRALPQSDDLALWRVEVRETRQTWDIADCLGKSEANYLAALPDVLDAAARVLAERDTGAPDPAAWIALRNAVRAAEDA